VRKQCPESIIDILKKYIPNKVRKIMEKFMIVLSMIVLLIIVLFFADYFSENKKKGRNAERRTRQILEKIADKKKYKIMNNVYLPLYNKTSETDHILIGNFGVCVIETKGISGIVSGKGEQLTHKIGQKTYKFYNPQYQNKTHVKNLEYHLKKGKFNNIPIYSIVVFTANDIELKSPVGIYLRDLEKEIRKLPASKCDANKIFNYIDSIRIKNPLKKFMHRFR